MHNFLYVAGLTATELGYLSAPVLPFIRQSAISLIPPERLAVSRPDLTVQRVVLPCFSQL